MAKTVVATYDGHGQPASFAGTMSGRIAFVPAGEHGFGWDRIFVPDGADRTLAQMLPEEKDRYSMRRDAFERMAEHFRIEPRRDGRTP
jgi:XTP/dITP diphosphohydrolase